jgi:uncharacterized protein
MVDAWLDRLRNLAREHGQGGGPAHDFTHVLRVEENARRIALAEGAAPAVVLPAAILHELINLPKDHPDSPRSGELSAVEAVRLLGQIGYPDEWIEPVALCIREHPFSLGLVPATLEGRVLQDADRLDAIGAIGIARCFAVCGELKRPLYEPGDPFCRSRRPDDKIYGLDHFEKKLLRIPSTLHTAAAREMARERAGFLRAFLEQMGTEIGRT